MTSCCLCGLQDIPLDHECGFQHLKNESHRKVVLLELIHKTLDPGQVAYLRGVIAGIELLQNAWLNGQFEEKNVIKP